MALGKKWKDYKCNLKGKNFNRQVPIEDALKANCPIGTVRYQWEGFLKYLYSKKGEEKERIGKESRKHQKFTHTAGSKSFARVSNEELIKTGKQLGRLDLFMKTHTKKDGTPLNLEVAEIMEKAKEKMSEYESMASNDDPINTDEIENIVITEIFGPERYGRVRFTGYGVNPKQFFGSNSKQYTYSKLQATEAEVDKLKDKVAQMEAEAKSREVDLQKLLAAREEDKKKYDNIEARLEKMMLMMQRKRPQALFS